MSLTSKLAVAFKRWGLPAVRRVQELTRKHGVLASARWWSDGEKV